ncbi:MAG: amino acid ABC transporter substrate-binding protein [Gammaproteobacteria bacterium]|nr:amino acid ABC transporter substrate-binding protein [Gammaproteobacteria bacterium]
MRSIRALKFTSVGLVVLLLGVAAQAETTLQKIAKSGEFVIGYRTDASPLSYENANGEPAGYSVDFCRRIAAAVKAHLGRDDIKAKFVRVKSADRITAVQNGLIDIECGSTTITLSRMAKVDFTIPTFVTGGSILSLADSNIQVLSDLAGKKVAVEKGTTTVDQLRAYLEENLIDAEVVLLDNRTAAMQQLTNGRVDAFASDQIVLIGQVIEALEPKRYALVDETFSYEPYGFVIRRNEAEFRLIANRAISQLYRSGQHVQIYNRWIGRTGVRPSPMLVAMFELNTIPE